MVSGFFPDESPGKKPEIVLNPGNPSQTYKPAIVFRANTRSAQAFALSGRFLSR